MLATRFQGGDVAIRNIFASMGLVVGFGITEAAAAQTVGTIALRGVVPPRADISLRALSQPAFSELSPSSGVVRLKLLAMTNAASAVNVQLMTASTSQNGPAMVAADGEVIPYGVQLNGKPLEFKDGVAIVGSILRSDSGRAAEDDFEIATPITGRAMAGAFTDHLVLVVSAR